MSRSNSVEPQTRDSNASFSRKKTRTSGKGDLTLVSTILGKLEQYLNRTRTPESSPVPRYSVDFFNKVYSKCKDSELTDKKIADAITLKEEISKCDDIKGIFECLTKHAKENQKMENAKSCGKKMISYFTESGYATTLELCLMQVIPVLQQLSQQQTTWDIKYSLSIELHNFLEFSKKTTEFGNFCNVRLIQLEGQNFSFRQF